MPRNTLSIKQLITALLILSSLAVASTFTQTATQPNMAAPVDSLQLHLDALVPAAETAYRKSPKATDSDSTVAKKDIDTAMAPIVGQRVSFKFRIDSILNSGGKKVVNGKIHVDSAIVLDATEKESIAAKKKAVEKAMSTKIKPPVTPQKQTQHKEHIAQEEAAYNAAVKKANDDAAKRIPDVAVQVEFDELPKTATVGNDLESTGWVRSITVSPAVKSGIAYASVKLIIAHEIPTAAATAPAH